MTGPATPPRRSSFAAELLRWQTPLILIAVIVLVACAGTLGDVVWERRVTFALVNLVAVIGLYIFMGNSGVLTLSSVGFMAIGAYVSALLTLPVNMKSMFLPHLPSLLAQANLDWPVAMLLAGLIPALVALVAGVMITRLSGIGASIATMSLLFMIYIVLGNWDELTGGQNSLMGLKTFVKLPVAAGLGAGAILIAFAYQESRWAVALRASREDEVAARSIGVRIVPMRLIAFVIGAFVSGIAGMGFAHFQGTLRVENFYLDSTFLFLSMLVIGGSGSLTGAVVGTFVVSGLTELFRLSEVGIALPDAAGRIAVPAGLGDVILPAVLLAILIFRPQGILAGRELILWPLHRNRE